ncbi:MAG TPA: hypothetical protein VFP68_22505, partial [Burkholderiaceae bacterium]|nr:hypothetical protein [Burkholderiaceae bacterium]
MPLRKRDAPVLHVGAQAVERTFAMVIQPAGLSGEEPPNAFFDSGSEFVDCLHPLLISRRIVIRDEKMFQLVEA